MQGNNIDTFAVVLFEQSKRFFEKASEGSDNIAQLAYLHASLMLGFCSLEAQINAIAEEFSKSPGLSIHEISVLMEKEVRLENGRFISYGLRMIRLDERILFIYEKFSGAPLDRTGSWWSELKTAMDLRNQLTHPKDNISITAAKVERALTAIIDTIDGLYRGVYKTGFPAAGRGLQSRFDF